MVFLNKGCVFVIFRYISLHLVFCVILLYVLSISLYFVIFRYSSLGIFRYIFLYFFIFLYISFYFGNFFIFW